MKKPYVTNIADRYICSNGSLRQLACRYQSIEAQFQYC